MTPERSLHARSYRHRSTGQGLTEYIIIVALIAIAAIGVVGLFGGVVKSQFGAMAAALGGGNGAAAMTAATGLGNQAAGEAGQAATLDTYAGAAAE